MKDRIEIFDTSLRDGTQGEAVSLSIHDKLNITQKLDEFGINIIEGGWPGSNPKDKEYFEKVKELELKNAKICAFGSTARSLNNVEKDANILALLEADTDIITIFGKTWRFHSQKSLGLSDSQNEALIYESLAFLKKHNKRVIFDAEHFFDGYKDDAVFALNMLKAAERAGADTIVLCDTNGGALPSEVYDITVEVKHLLSADLGIHAHNDSECAVANSLAAVQAGAIHVQGTINGLGERCGNANLCSVLPNLSYKLSKQTDLDDNLKHLTSLANYMYEIMNLIPNTRSAFVGKSAFTHKGGIHVSSVLKDSRMYEHINPESVGNKQHVLVSDLSGQSNIRYKAKELGIHLPNDRDFSKQFVSTIKNLEYEGFQFDGAEASFELRLLKDLQQFNPFFEVIYTKSNVMFDDDNHKYAEAVLKVKVGDEIEHTAADGNGPVNALDKALRKAIGRFYPEIRSMHLIDYKVRVLGGKSSTGAKVRVLVESGDGEKSWSTVGVSHNIIEASLQALSDGINYKIYQHRKKRKALDIDAAIS